MDSEGERGRGPTEDKEGWLRIIPDASTIDAYKYRTFPIWAAPEDCLATGFDFQFAFVPKKGAKGVSGCTVALLRLPATEEGPRQPPHFESLQRIPPDWVVHWTTFPVTCSESGMATTVHRIDDTWKTVNLKKDDTIACFVRASELQNPWFHIMGNLEMRVRTDKKNSS